MATGIPKSRRKRTPLQDNTGVLPVGGAFGLQVVYEGKATERAILAVPPAEIAEFESTSTPQTAPNRLYFGDNLPLLSALMRDPTVRGHVTLIYIDPPYATNSTFESRNQEAAYDDLLTGPHYVEFLRKRLILLRELLAPNGSIYVHLDKNMEFAVKLIMDEVFGPEHFRNWITRRKCHPKNYTRNAYGNVADYILFYTKSDAYVWNRPVEEWTPERIAKEYPCVDADGRRYKKVPIHAPGVRKGDTGKAWRGHMPPPGKHWQYIPDKLDEFDARGEIYWSPSGNPRRKVFLDTSDGVAVQDIWLDMLDAHNQNIKITGYPTEKNPDLMRRIIEASSRPGDVVLDAFSGSGTTLAVASQLGRRWIGIDSSQQAILTTLRRFAHGPQPMGDYVAGNSASRRPAGASRRTSSALQLGLAGSPTTLPSGHVPIYDFNLLVECAARRFDDAQAAEAHRILTSLRAIPLGEDLGRVAEVPPRSPVKLPPDDSEGPSTLWSGLDAVG